MFRLKTAIAVEHKHSRIPVEAKVKKSGAESTDKTPETVRTVGPLDPPDPASDDDTSDGEESDARNSNRDLPLLDGVRDADEQIDVKRLLES